MKRRIFICGPSASGKDYFTNFLKKQEGVLCLPKTTTRPKREGEIEGDTYYFVDNDIFLESINNNDIVYYQKFTVKDNNIWYYGMTHDTFFSSNTFIVTPYELQLICDSVYGDISQSILVYFNIDENVRLERLKNRNDNSDDIYRRIESDRKDFEKLPNLIEKYKIKTIVVDEPSYSVQELWQKINETEL